MAKKCLDISKELVIKLYWEDGLTLSQVAKKVNKSVGLINRILWDSGRGTRGCSIAQEKSNKTDLIDKDILIDLYVNQQRSLIEIGEQFNFAPSTIKRTLKKLGIQIRKPWEQNKKNISTEQIIDLYWNKGLDVIAITKIINKSETLIKNRLIESGKGIRSLSETARINKGTNDIKDEELINMYNNLNMSCEEIARYFHVTAGCIRYRLLLYNQKFRGIKGENHPGWKGGITEIADGIRHGANYANWRKRLFEKNNYKSQISGENGHLHCHHITPFSIILKSSETKHKPLDGQIKKLAIYHDERFYDTDNGLCLTEDEHHLLEKTPKNGHPWWRIWKTFPEFDIKNSSLTENDMGLFNGEGEISGSESIITIGQKYEVDKIIRYEHYLGIVPRASKILIARIGNVVTGIATFGRGANKSLPEDTLELTRLCIPHYVVKPFSCEFMNKSCEKIKKLFPEIKHIISYCDPSVGHNGGVYRMAGWKKDGKTTSSYSYFDPLDNQLKHKSCCRRIKDVDKPEKQLAEERGLIKILLPPKYRYKLTF